MVHEKVQVIWMLMLKSAGFESVRLEDRSFDAAATADDKDHRRPDIVCVWGGVRYIIDVTIAWASEMGPVEWRDVGHDADKAAKAKERSYAKALKREAEGGHGWLKHVRGREVDRFMPIAYEMCGTWGTAARSFFKFVVKCAGSEGTRAAELYLEGVEYTAGV